MNVLSKLTLTDTDRKKLFISLSFVMNSNLLSIASDQQRPESGQTELLKYWGVWSGNIIDGSGEIKGVRWTGRRGRVVHITLIEPVINSPFNL
jgi:hypothetical protein